MNENEKFLERMRAYEDEDSAPTLLASLEQHGVKVPPPDELAEEELESRLWDVINGLALLGVYLDQTDHLSDAELYRKLWDELGEPAVLFPDDPSFGYHIDFVSSGSDEDNEAYLRYYADNVHRKAWQEDWGEPIPPKEDPPYDRDRKLPRRSFSVTQSEPPRS